MTYRTESLETVSTVNSNSSLSQTAYNENSDLVAAATTTTITLGTSASTTADIYNNLVIEITEGPGLAQARLITDYTAGKVASLNKNLGELPDTTSTYVVHRQSGQCQTQDQANRYTTVKLASTANSNNDYYKNCFIKLWHCAEHETSLRCITAYNGTTKVATLDTALACLPDGDSLYVIYGESGTAQTGAASTITLDGTLSSATDDYYNGLYIDITAGTGVGQSRLISDYVGATKIATVSVSWDTTPDNTSEFTIYGGWAGEFEDCSKNSSITVTTVITEGDIAVIDMQLGLTSTGSSKRQKYIENSIKFPTSVHSHTVISEYYKQKLVGMGTTVTGNHQTIFHTQKNNAISSVINENINAKNDCLLTRSVLAAQNSDGVFRNVNADNESNLFVNISNPHDAYGNLAVSSPEESISMVFHYNITPFENETFVKGSGAASVADSLCTVSSGTTANSASRVSTLGRAKYVPGTALNVRFTALFTQGVSSTTQLIGLGDESNGMFFGYNGADFGLMLRSGGKQEVRTLTVTSGASSTGNMTVTLNGNATSVAVTSGDNVRAVARKIAAANFSDAGDGWIAYENDDDVIFISRVTGSKAGTYSISGQGTAGSFASNITGVSATDTWVTQTQWNVDRGFGEGSLPVMDFTKGNVFEISIQWLGFGNIMFNIENPYNGHLETVHRIRYPNANTLPSVINPNNPLMIYVDNGATTNDISTKTACMSALVYGKRNLTVGSYFGISSVHDSVNLNSGNDLNILTIRNNPLFQNQKNKSDVVLTNLTLGYESSKSAIIKAYFNADLDNATTNTWTQVSGGASVISYCEDEKNVTNGLEIATFSMGIDGKIDKNLLDYQFIIPPGNQISFTIIPLANVNGTDFTCSLTWVERL
uniref:Uncharacterized protein n=1 Tax=viral metagenome TaxID=1070528 RepID=A0A6C0CM76_9ZZZZ